MLLFSAYDVTARVCEWMLSPSSAIFLPKSVLIREDLPTPVLPNMKMHKEVLFATHPCTAERSLLSSIAAILSDGRTAPRADPHYDL